MTDEQIARLIARRDRLTGRSDERINRPALDEIDAQLATVPPGQRNDIDLLLGRPGAILPPRDALARAAAESGAEAQWLTPREVARLNNDSMARIAADAMQNQQPIEY